MPDRHKLSFERSVRLMCDADRQDAEVKIIRNVFTAHEMLEAYQFHAGGSAMPDVDCSDQGPAVLQEQPIDECANDECQKEIYPGQQVWKHGPDHYCSGVCLAKGLGAKTTEL